MKNIFSRNIYSLILFVLSTTTTSSYAQEQWSNRWKESSRKDEKGKAIAFTDTMMLTTTDQVSVSIRKGNGFQYNGTVEGDMLDLGGKEYTVKKMNKETIILSDEMATYTLMREKKNMEHANAAKNIAENKAPDKPLLQVDFKMLVGKWTVYKRENKGTAPARINYNTQLNIVNINSETDMQFFASKSNQSPYVTYQKFERGTLTMITTGQETKNFTILKATADEIIIEDADNMLYFLKRF
jgi:hypothetical protein